MTWNHVTVIDSVSGNTINVLEQNSSPSGRNSYTFSQVSCFLTAGGGGGLCSGLSDGTYCGNDGIHGGQANTLYTCSGGNVASTSTCKFVCEVMPSGTADRCASGSCSGLENGYYCGNDQIGGDPNGLYQCQGGNGETCKYCTSGCQVSPPGQPDKCK